MKHTKKKKKRLRASKPVGGKDVAPETENEERRLLNSLMEAFASVSLEDTVSAYREANGDPNKAAEILGGLAEDRTTTFSSSSANLGSTSSSTSSDVFMEANCGQNGVREKGRRGSKPKKVVAATGMVSTVLGKDYVRSTPRRDSSKPKRFSDGSASKADAEQFLCSMLGDDCELSMDVVTDVLCQCSYDVEKALDIFLELSASSCELSKNCLCHDCNANVKEDTRFFLESSDNLTDRASDSTSHSSGSEIQDSVWYMGHQRRNYSKVLTGSDAHSSTSLQSSESGLPQLVLESLFNTPKSSEHEPNTMNWRNVVKKMGSLGQRFEFCTSGNAEPHQQTNAKGNEYQELRKTAKKHWDSMKSYYQQAATAYTNGKQEHAAYLSEQGRMQNKIALEADEKASQDIFKARNKSIENVITIDLHGQHVKQAMRLLKLHLLFGAYVRSVRLFRVITGCGSNGLGKSKVKQLVTNLIEKEGIQWSEENRGTLLIRLDGQREFSFLDSESDCFISVRYGRLTISRELTRGVGGGRPTVRCFICVQYLLCRKTRSLSPRQTVVSDIFSGFGLHCTIMR